MKKTLLVLLALLNMQLTFAERPFPNTMDVAVLKGYQQRQVVLSPDGFSWLKYLTLGWLDQSQSFNLSAAVKVKDQANRYVTYNNLSKNIGKVVAVKRDPYNNINEIWILTDHEREQFRHLAKQREVNQQ